MKKYILIALVVFITTITSCERDDFCTSNNPTPHLVLRFYDVNDNSLRKNVDSLYVWAQGKDSIYKNQTIDSITLPLNTTTNETVYHLSQGTLNTGTLTVKYTPELDFVSRSCGFRYTFKDVTLTNNSNWIQNLSVSEISVINNQTSEHVQVRH